MASLPSYRASFLFIWFACMTCVSYPKIVHSEPGHLLAEEEQPFSSCFETTNPVSGEIDLPTAASTDFSLTIDQDGPLFLSGDARALTIKRLLLNDAARSKDKVVPTKIPIVMKSNHLGVLSCSIPAPITGDTQLTFGESNALPYAFFSARILEGEVWIAFTHNETLHALKIELRETSACSIVRSGIPLKKNTVDPRLLLSRGDLAGFIFRKEKKRHRSDLIFLDLSGPDTNSYVAAKNISGSKWDAVIRNDRIVTLFSREGVLHTAKFDLKDQSINEETIMPEQSTAMNPIFVRPENSGLILYYSYIGYNQEGPNWGLFLKSLGNKINSGRVWPKCLGAFEPSPSEKTFSAADSNNLVFFGRVKGDVVKQYLFDLRD